MIAAIVTAAVLTASPPPYPTPVDQVQYQECVAERESNGRANAVSPTGTYRGKYQFNAPLARGATWHIMPWLRQWHPAPKRYAAQLRRTPMDRWPERVQDAAFVMTLNYGGVKWSGKRHWKGGRWSC
jgi:hypothetical protein